MLRSFSIAAAIGLAVSLVACGDGGPDPASETEKALRDARLEGIQVDWDEDARIAHLKGTVETATDRQRAEDVAASTVGTTGRVLNELTVRGMNEKVADDLDGQIRSTLNEMVENDQVLRDRDVNFEVANGVVTVKGKVRTVAEKAKVTELVRAAPGVKDFANALDIKPEQ
jgi:osmotically-inducible protein OsmY